MSESFEFSSDPKPSTPLLWALERAQESALQGELTPRDRMQLQEELKAVIKELRERGEMTVTPTHPVEEIISHTAIVQVFLEATEEAAIAIEAVIRASQDNVTKEVVSSRAEDLEQSIAKIIEMLKKYPWLAPRT